MAGTTDLTIDGEDFALNGRKTYPGRTWRGHRAQARLLRPRAGDRRRLTIG
jgi:hypothetical protein